MLAVSINASFSGIEEFEEGNETVTCIINSTLYPPSHVLILYFSIYSGDPVINDILKNTSLYKTSEVYDSKSDTYTTTVRTAHIPVTSRHNDQAFVCSGVVNTFQFLKAETFIVLCKYQWYLFHLIRYIFPSSIWYDGILLPPIININFVTMQHIIIQRNYMSTCEISMLI